MAVSIKKLTECSLNDILSAWNDGFQGYDVNVSMDMKQFLARMDMQNLSPEHSFIAFDEQKPVGIVLNGLMTIDQGKTVAWNGGTAVAPEYRNKGIGRMLLEASLEMYREENIHLATLEALTQNKKAIRLYESVGYEVVDELLLLRKKEIEMHRVNEELLLAYSVETKAAEALHSVRFYPDLVPWQTDFRSVKGGEVMFIYRDGMLVGYILFKRSYNELGAVKDVMIFQCEVVEEKDQQDIIHYAFYVFTKSCNGANCKVMNLRKSHTHFVNILEKAGFHVFAKQVFMVKKLSRTG